MISKQTRGINPLFVKTMYLPYTGTMRCCQASWNWARPFTTGQRYTMYTRRSLWQPVMTNETHLRRRRPGKLDNGVLVMPTPNENDAKDITNILI